MQIATNVFRTLCLVLLITSCFIVSCGSKKPKTKDEDASVTNNTQEQNTSLPAPSTTSPGKEETVNSSEKCFSSEGLKFSVTIKMKINGENVSGQVASTDAGSNQTKTADFSGTLSGDKIMTRFKGDPPVIGDASEWTNNPWILDKSGKNETLLIIFNAKNYETNNWEDQKYEFTSCSK
jgi:hypothetical protein